jgi:hypothetical protein
MGRYVLFIVFNVLTDESNLLFYQRKEVPGKEMPGAAPPF